MALKCRQDEYILAR